MRFVAVASACGPSRGLALADLRSVAGRTWVRYDRSGHGLVRYVQRAGGPPAPDAVVNLPHGGTCGSGDDLRDAVGEDLQACLDLLAGAAVAELVIVLPEGMDLVVALAAAQAAGCEHELASLVMAVDPAALEDLLWTPDSLQDRGLAVYVEDRRTLGEFLVANLLTADTVALTGPVRTKSDEGTALLTHIAPWAPQISLAESVRWAGFDAAELDARAEPARVCVPVRMTSPDGVRTEVFALTRPLHSVRLAERMASICAGAVFSRGKLWLAVVPERRLAWWGVGPEAGFEDAGPWLHPRVAPSVRVNAEQALDWRPHFGDRGTRLAFTGRDVDAAEIAALLRECSLDDEEFEAFGAGTLADADPWGMAARFAASSIHPTQAGRASRRYANRFVR